MATSVESVMFEVEKLLTVIKRSSMSCLNVWLDVM